MLHDDNADAVYLPTWAASVQVAKRLPAAAEGRNGTQHEAYLKPRAWTAMSRVMRQEASAMEVSGMDVLVAVSARPSSLSPYLRMFCSFVLASLS